MSVSLAESYDYCRRVARTRARNFYYSFLLLSKAEKDAMCAVYAFNRYCDDLSDGPEAARPETFDEWRRDLDRALDGAAAGHPLWPAFRDSVERFSIPRRYFHEMIDGVRSDIGPRRIATFDELYGYCYKVASVVGLTVVRIFGFEDERALDLAEKCGVAFQLTNILRDVKEDYALGRVYLPAEDLARFDVDLNHLAMSQGFRELMRFEVERARAYYVESRPLIAMVQSKNRPAMWALIEIYRRLLERIERSGYDVLSRRIHLPFPEKLAILTRAAIEKPGTARMFPGS